ncbi:hypothetical protein GOEFS_035_00810 [Gordonia effusa NBRC 100432]|uniref:Uncharacterized protein n=1 Tax=Gordonia effusa NBRC 100432 TaxID=1077974 RepID=H0QXJ8_9ACTN|nr:hypothetical protein GOEFS_035_00810 [Gordonia effusa NBRC 100432]
MRTNAFGKCTARFVGAAIAIAAVAFLMTLGGGTANAGTSCNVENGHRVQKIVGKSACAATAGKGSKASAEDSSSGGTAISVADNGGNAHSRNLQPGSTALAGANTRGNAYSVTTGPSAQSVAQAKRGATAVAIGGWAGEAYASPKGTACIGGFAAAYESSTGKMCVRSGSFYYQN